MNKTLKMIKKLNLKVKKTASYHGDLIYYEIETDLPENTAIYFTEGKHYDTMVNIFSNGQVVESFVLPEEKIDVENKIKFLEKELNKTKGIVKAYQTLINMFNEKILPN